MPVKRRTRGTRTRKVRRPRARYGPSSVVGTRGYRRNQGITMHTFYFRSFNTVTSDVSGVIFDQTSPVDVFTGGQGFSTHKALYSQYKVMSVSITYRALNVGTESAASGPNRGTAASWVNVDNIDSQPAGFNNIISRPSLRFVNPRSSHRRVLTRPKGYPGWGDCQAGSYNDPWENATISLMVEDASASKDLYTSVATWKVVFRGRVS